MRARIVMAALFAGVAAAPAACDDARTPVDGGEAGDVPGDVPGDVRGDVLVDAAGEDAAADSADDAPLPTPCPDAAPLPGPPGPVTFFVAADTHCDPEPDPGHVATATAMRRLAAEGRWPGSVDGEATGFAPEPIGEPAGVVFVGDLTGSGDSSPWYNELATFRRFFDTASGPDALPWPAFVGLGNHDLDRDGLGADAYREAMWAYVAERHRGPDAPVPAACFDAAGSGYSWDWAGVHLVQTHKFAGDVDWDHPSGLPWLESELAARAGDGRPVVLFQHYGLDAFGTEDRWWTAADREALLRALAPYRVAALVAGHSHFAMTYERSGLRVIQVNNAKAELGTGNDDGNGSFAVLRVSDSRLDLITCRWLDETGDFELIAPWLSVEI